MHVIAEAGQTMQGDVDRAVEMVQRFAAAGATDFKVQMIDPEKLATWDAQSYWHTGPVDRQRSVFAANGLIPHNGWDRVRQACFQMNIGFGATPFDLDAVDALAGLSPDFVKVASGDITYLPLLHRIGEKFPSTPIVLSTGASSFDEIITAMRMLNDSGVTASKIVPMACTLRYPAVEALLYRIPNLLKRLWDSWRCEVGYSDHTTSTATGMFAALAGATWIEKHVTPWGSRNSDATPDDAMGLTDTEFRQYVEGVKGAMKLLDDGGTSGGEMPARLGARRAARYRQDFSCGHVSISTDDFTYLRPSPDGTGTSIAVAQHAVDDRTPLCRDVKAGDVVRVGDFVLL